MKPLPVDSVTCFATQGRPSLRVVTNGHPWILDAQKTTLLAAGLVSLPESMADEFGESFDVPGGDEEEPVTFTGCSQDPVVVDMARRLWIGEIEPGKPVLVNTPAVAAAAKWVIDGERRIFRREI